jgi:hypothetical protein
LSIIIILSLQSTSHGFHAFRKIGNMIDHSSIRGERQRERERERERKKNVDMLFIPYINIYLG